MSLSKNDLAAIYRACEEMETFNYEDSVYDNDELHWKFMDFLFGPYAEEWLEQDEYVLALLFFATIMQEGGV